MNNGYWDFMRGAKIGRIIVAVAALIVTIFQTVQGNYSTAFVAALYGAINLIDLLSMKFEQDIMDIEKRTRGRMVKIHIVSMLLDHVRDLEREGKYTEGRAVLKAIDPIHTSDKLENLIKTGEEE